MQHQFEFTYDIQFIKDAMRRDILWRGYLLGGLMLFLLGWFRWTNGFFDPSLSTTLVLLALFFVVGIRAVHRTYAGRIFEMWTKMSPDHTVRYELDEEGFTVVLHESRSRLQWSGLRRLWCYSDVWLIEVVKMQSVFFPPNQAPESARKYMVERCKAAGVRVRPG